MRFSQFSGSFGPPGRRAVLTGAVGAVGVAALGTGCTAEGGVRAERRRADATRKARRAAARQSRVLLGHYTRTATVHSVLAERLEPMRVVVARHLEELEEPGGNGGDRGAGPEVPAEAKAAVDALVAAERRTARDREDALLTSPPEIARLLASLAAAGSVNAYLLSALPDGPAEEGDEA